MWSNRWYFEGAGSRLKTGRIKLSRRMLPETSAMAISMISIVWPEPTVSVSIINARSPSFVQL